MVSIDKNRCGSDLPDMTTPIFVSPEQEAIINEVIGLDKSFANNPKLFHSVTAIAMAKGLIEKAVNAGLDERVYHPLQIYISLHETEQSMPERLRGWQPLP